MVLLMVLLLVLLLVAATTKLVRMEKLELLEVRAAGARLALARR